ncbi:MAG: thiamine-phosphate kinase [Chloroflexi bacterium]|nr:thiamine-phosphate kinase [Chloroflexota bacterium]
MALTLGDIGEFGLIDRIAKKAFANQEMALGFQDDAALWHQGTGWLVATTDALVEDVDFRLGTFSWEEIGWKALAASLSDIAAMGGTPVGAFITLCLPAKCEIADVTAFYEGMAPLAKESRTPILGGDLSSSEQVIVNVAVFGEVESRERVLLRTTAQVGDQIAVTGVLGSASAGLMLLERGDSGRNSHAVRFTSAQRRPIPRLREGRALVEAGVRCGMDVSDGLVADLQKLCAASGVAAEIKLEDIPTDPELPLILGRSHRTRAICGGEDFELLFAAPPDTMQRAKDHLNAKTLEQATVIGTIVSGHSGVVTVRDERGIVVPVDRLGFDHFGADGIPIPGD